MRTKILGHAAGLFAAAMLSFSTAGGAAEYAKVDAARLLKAEKEPHNWMTHGGTYAEAHYSPLAQINTTNVANLKLGGFKSEAQQFDDDAERSRRTRA